MSIQKWLIVAVLALAVALAGWLYYHRDAAQLERAVRRMVSLTTKKKGESLVSAASRAQAFAQYFIPMPDVRMDEIPGPLNNRTDIQALHFEFRKDLDSMAITVLEKQVRLDETGETATMRILAMTQIAVGSEQDTLTRDFEIQWVKIRREGWRIRSVRVYETSNRPGTVWMNNRDPARDGAS